MESYQQLVDVTLWNLQASSLDPSQIVYVILNTINSVVHFFFVQPTSISMHEKSIWTPHDQSRNS